jgi:hypothetical protein
MISSRPQKMLLAQLVLKWKSLSQFLHPIPEEM